MRFTTRVLVLQVLAVAAVTAVCASVFLGFAIAQLKSEAENAALSIARTVASQPEVRAEVARQSAGADPVAELSRGAVQRVAMATTERTGALFVVVTDDDGIRLAHPEGDRLGQRVSTDYSEALAGREVTAWERGTLGESARAKVPVYPPGGGRPVGEVSVGFERAGVFDDLPPLLLGVSVAILGALAIGVLTAVLLRRRLERLTLGLQPEELTALVQQQAAVFDGVDNGVLAVDAEGIVRVCNASAARLLGLGDPVGAPRESLDLPPDIAAPLRAPGSFDGVVVGGRVLYGDSHAVTRRGTPLGVVLIVRDRTDLVALTERLESVKSMTLALRVQRHEFANRMHVAAGLLDADRLTEAREFLAEMTSQDAFEGTLVGAQYLSEPFLASFLGGKALEAAERHVTLAVGPDSLVLGSVTSPEDVATVLGNLVDNAITAASVGEGGVEVTAMDSGETLVLTVADSGPGIAPGTDVFAPKDEDTDWASDAVHGHGIGLRLSRELLRAHDGELWVIQDSGGPLGGAVMGARIPRAMTRRVPGEGGGE